MALWVLLGRAVVSPANRDLGLERRGSHQTQWELVLFPEHHAEGSKTQQQKKSTTAGLMCQLETSLARDLSFVLDYNGEKRCFRFCCSLCSLTSRGVCIWIVSSASVYFFLTRSSSVVSWLCGTHECTMVSTIFLSLCRLKCFAAQISSHACRFCIFHFGTSPDQGGSAVIRAARARLPA